MQTAALAGLALITVGYICCFLRLATGPSLPDRIVALDLIAALTLGLCAAYTLKTGNPIYLDVAVVLALITFLGTIALAIYLEKRMD